MSATVLTVLNERQLEGWGGPGSERRPVGHGRSLEETATMEPQSQSSGAVNA